MLDEIYLHMKTIDEKVEMGKMMSCDGITYEGKVFCFEYKDKMVFKLGKDYDIESHGIKSYNFLNPFKKKGPMKAWFELNLDQNKHFLKLAQVALEVMKNA